MIKAKAEFSSSDISRDQRHMVHLELRRKRAQMKKLWEEADGVKITDSERNKALVARLQSLATEIAALERQLADYRRSGGASAYQ